MVITVIFQRFAFRVHSKQVIVARDYFSYSLSHPFPELYNWALHQRIKFIVVKYKIIKLRYKTLNDIQMIKHSKLNVTWKCLEITPGNLKNMYLKHSTRKKIGIKEGPFNQRNRNFCITCWEWSLASIDTKVLFFIIGVFKDPSRMLFNIHNLEVVCLNSVEMWGGYMFLYPGYVLNNFTNNLSKLETE